MVRRVAASARSRAWRGGWSGPSRSQSTRIRSGASLIAPPPGSRRTARTRTRWRRASRAPRSAVASTPFPRGCPGSAHLARRQAEIVGQDECRPLLDRKLQEGALQLVPIDEPAEMVLDPRLVDGEHGDLVWPPPEAPHLVLAGVDEEPMQPGVEPLRIAQAAQLMPGADERLLDRILRRVAVAEDPSSRSRTGGCTRRSRAHRMPRDRPAARARQARTPTAGPCSPTRGRPASAEYDAGGAPILQIDRLSDAEPTRRGGGTIGRPCPTRPTATRRSSMPAG